MKISSIGEFGLINALAEMIVQSRDKTERARRELVIDIGDDDMVWKPANPYQMATVDSMVQDVHFTLGTITWRELGWKSIAVNLSDIAAMGGAPMYALISIGLPEDTDVADVKALYRGMLDCAVKHGTAITGGDTVHSPFVFVSVTVIGCASNLEGRMLTRSAAAPGDLVAVTGELGNSAAGLRMLLDKVTCAPRTASTLRKAHLTPTPRIAEGQALVKCGVLAGMDISDGLVGDLTHICEMSRVGAKLNVDAVPVGRAAKACFGEKALGMALTGGEDYELLFTAPPGVMAKVEKALDCPVTVVGEITQEHAGAVTPVDAKGKRSKLDKKGWDHFSAVPGK